MSQWKNRRGLRAEDRMDRGLLVGVHLARGGEVSVKWLMDHLGCSFATAKRDMLVIETTLFATATFGANNRKSLSLPHNGSNFCGAAGCSHCNVL